MAIYVVDASVVVQYAITQTYTPEARVLVARMYQGDQLCIPEFCLLECVNVLWKEVRFRGLLKTQAEQIVGELLALSFRIMPTVHLLPSALQIGGQIMIVVILLTSTSAKIYANIHSFSPIGFSRKYYCAILVNNPTLGFN